MDPRFPHLNKIKVKETVDTVKLRPPIYLKVAKLTCKTKILYPFLKYEQVTHYCLPSNKHIIACLPTTKSHRKCLNENLYLKLQRTHTIIFLACLITRSCELLHFGNAPSARVYLPSVNFLKSWMSSSNIMKMYTSISLSLGYIQQF